MSADVVRIIIYIMFEKPGWNVKMWYVLQIDVVRHQLMKIMNQFIRKLLQEEEQVHITCNPPYQCHEPRTYMNNWKPTRAPLVQRMNHQRKYKKQQGAKGKNKLRDDDMHFSLSHRGDRVGIILGIFATSTLSLNIDFACIIIKGQSLSKTII